MDETDCRTELDRATGGDADALQRLILHYHAPLRAAVDAKMDAPVRRYLDVDDVLQEAYVAAFKSVRGCRFSAPGAFYKWLERIALNELVDQRRALARRKRDVARDARQPVDAASSYPDLLNRLAAADRTPSHYIARSEAVAAVLSSLARLTDDQRRVIQLRFLQGRSVAEVAARLNKSEPAVHMLCHRALTSLRTLMVSRRDNAGKRDRSDYTLRAYRGRGRPSTIVLVPFFFSRARIRIAVFDPATGGRPRSRKLPRPHRDRSSPVAVAAPARLLGGNREQSPISRRSAADRVGFGHAPCRVDLFDILCVLDGYSHAKGECRSIGMAGASTCPAICFHLHFQALIATI